MTSRPSVTPLKPASAPCWAWRWDLSICRCLCTHASICMFHNLTTGSWWCPRWSLCLRQCWIKGLVKTLCSHSRESSRFKVSNGTSTQASRTATYCIIRGFTACESVTVHTELLDLLLMPDYRKCALCVFTVALVLLCNHNYKGYVLCIDWHQIVYYSIRYSFYLYLWLTS